MYVDANLVIMVKKFIIYNVLDGECLLKINKMMQADIVRHIDYLLDIIKLQAVAIQVILVDFPMGSQNFI